MGRIFSNLITSIHNNSYLTSYKRKHKINYQKILSKIPVPISLWELNGEDFFLLFSNKQAEEIFDPKLTSKARLSEVFPNEYKNVFSQKFSICDGNLSTKVMLDKNLLLISHNKYGENLLNRSSNQNQDNYKREPFKTIIEQSPVSIVITDIQGNIEYINPKFVEITGYSIDEVIGKNPRILKSGNTSLEEYKKLWDTILSGNVWKGEFINKRKNGELYYEFAVISPIKDQDGIINNFIGIKEDITKLKETDIELKKSEKLAALGKMAAYVSHEIKTPLTSIKINVDILEQNKSIDADSKRSLLIIQKEIKRLTNLLKNILHFVNYSSLFLSNINLYKKVDNIKEFLEPLLKEKRVALLNKTLDHNIFGDAQQLRSLFILLIENSIESMDAGGEIEISSELKGDKCYIYLKDNGRGVNCGENIFEPFVTTKSTGTGLGLPIAKNIVDKHQGSIRLVSSKQGETIFEIILQSRGERIGKIINN